MPTADFIAADSAGTLPGLLAERINRSPEAIAYLQYDHSNQSWRSCCWREIGESVGNWKRHLAAARLVPGDRIAIWLGNSIEWVGCCQAALESGLVVVPLYFSDNPENVAHILADCGARLLVTIHPEKWMTLRQNRPQLRDLKCVLCLRRGAPGSYPEVLFIEDDAPDAPSSPAIDPMGTAMIVYTSSTTGSAKGVMLSHRNLLWNAEAVLRAVPAYREDRFLSILPLSHSFELTAGHLVPMMAGASVAFCRSVQDLPDDLLAIAPSVLIAVPRLFERSCGKIASAAKRFRPLLELTARLGWKRIDSGSLPAWQAVLLLLLDPLFARPVRAHFGGRLRLAVSGGAALDPEVSHFLLGLGVPVIQGYGLTEASPVVACNRLQDNLPDSVGRPLRGVEVSIGADHELLVKSPGVMQGYWNRPRQSREAVDAAGWLHTGDLARIDQGRIQLMGRIKDVLVLSTGEKVSMVDLEQAICRDPLFDAAMVVGNGKPFVGALLVLNRSRWEDLARQLGLPPDPESLAALAARREALGRIDRKLHGFPSYARVRSVWLLLDPWTLENGLLTATMKKKRHAIEQRFESCINAMYAGHETFQMA